MINIIGLFILAMGFFLPYLLDIRVPSTLFFWLGGLLILNKGILIRGKWRWPKWSTVGILVNIILVICTIAVSFLIEERSLTVFEYRLTQLLYWISNPATALGQKTFPYPETHYSDGSVAFLISAYRTVTTAFLNVVIFAFIFGLGSLFFKQKNIKASEQVAPLDRE